jgi:hypothetical protein
MGDLWNTRVRAKEPTPAQIARFTTTHAYVVGVCVDVVQLAFKAAGGTVVYQRGPLDRCPRDVLTMNQHVIVTLRTYEMAGRLLFGRRTYRRSSSQSSPTIGGPKSWCAALATSRKPAC